MMQRRVKAVEHVFSHYWHHSPTLPTYLRSGGRLIWKLIRLPLGGGKQARNAWDGAVLLRSLLSGENFDLKVAKVWCEKLWRHFTTSYSWAQYRRTEETIKLVGIYCIKRLFPGIRVVGVLISSKGLLLLWDSVQCMKQLWNNRFFFFAKYQHN